MARISAANSEGPAVPRKRTTRVVSSDEDSSDNDRRPAAAESSRRVSNRRAVVKRQRSETPVGAGGDQDDADLDALDSDTEAASRRRAKGKQRANGEVNGHGERSGHRAFHAESGVEEDEEGQRLQQSRPEYQRGSDGYVAGSVTRIKLINFMTYDHVEFRPGPHLNMILGPNGTGKSTVAAGIAIGLGFHPRVMGRATDLKSYVKQGCEEAQVEIELKAFHGKRNPVIWRRFNKHDEKSEWRLNNEASTKKAVTDIVAGFGIQANNLCCFLAQDKVADFARMTPEQVLTETMRAAGDPRLSKWHEQLIELGGAQKGIETAYEATRNDRDTVSNQVKVLEPDVQHYEERAELEIRAQVLRCLRVAAERVLNMRRQKLAMDQQRALRAEMKEAIKRTKPIRDLETSYKAKKATTEARVKKAEDYVGDLAKKMKKGLEDVRRKEEEVGDIDHRLDNIKNEILRDAKARQTHQTRIKEAQAILDQPVEDVSAQLNAINEEKARVSAQLSNFRRAAHDAKAKYDGLVGESEDVRRQTEVKTDMHKRLSSIQAQREQAAANSDPSIEYVLGWLKDHEGEFEDKVCRPPMISVNVRDQRYVSQVESATNRGQRSTWIVQTKNDYERLLALNGTPYPAKTVTYPNGQQRHIQAGVVRLYISQVTVNEATCNPAKSCSPEVLRGLGFDGWASDYVEAEAPVIAFLNERCGLSGTAITLTAGDRIDTNAVFGAGIYKWITSKQVCSANRSRYGRQAINMSASPSHPAVAFNMTVDTEGVQKLVNEITRLKRLARDNEAPKEAARIEADKAEERITAARRKEAELVAAQNEIRSANVGRLKAQETLRKAQQDLQRLGNENYEAKRADLRARKMANLKDRAAIIKANQAVEEKCLEYEAALSKRTVEHAQACTDLAAIEGKISGNSDEIAQLEEQIGALIETDKNIKAHIRTLDADIAERNRKLVALNSDHLLEERLMQLEPPENDPDGEPALSIRDIAEELGEVEVRLELSVGIDAGVIQNYKDLKARLEALQKRADEEGKQLDTVKRKIARIQREFDPALDALIGAVDRKFSDAFEYVGCAGQVSVRRHPEGFDLWAVEIRVAYRDGDKMEILSGFRQSGGERALATISYLMSLTGMARVPFSLVDEINQGMDQRAERNVHDQLVGVTCQPEAGQYFLITPKLLTDLKYHKRMKILNVNNGVWLPEPAGQKRQKWTDFKGCISRYRAAHGIAAA